MTKEEDRKNMYIIMLLYMHTKLIMRTFLESHSSNTVCYETLMK